MIRTVRSPVIIPLLSIVGLVIWMTCSAAALAAGEPTKLSEILKDGLTGAKPAEPYYYVSVYAAPDTGAQVPEVTCVDGNLWALARRFIGITKSASAVLTAKITPSNAPSEAITVPIFVTSAAEVDRSSNKGSSCKTQFWSRGLTFLFNSNLNPTFDLDLTFHFANEANVAAVNNILTEATNLMTMIGGASGTPAALAPILADPKIRDLSTRIDAELSSIFTSNTDIQVTKQLTTGSEGTQALDKITFKMPTIETRAGGPSTGPWGAGGSIFLSYSREKFKSSGIWIDPDAIMVKPIVPSNVPNAQSTLQKILLNGDASTGFDLSSLKSATNQESLSDACRKLRQFLASFLIPDDALAARFAVLKNSVYERRPELRDESDCFSSDDLQALRSKMGAAFAFGEHIRKEPDREKMIETRMGPVRIALLTQNPSLIRKVAASPIDTFDVVFGKRQEDYATGETAIARLAEGPIKLVCYQASPEKDLSEIAAVASYKGKRTGAVVSFDATGKWKSLVFMPAQQVADDVGIERKQWLDPKKIGCAVDE